MRHRCKAGLKIPGLILLIIAFSYNLAWSSAFFGPKDYVRGSGAPKQATDSFSATAAERTCILKAYNGGLEDANGEKVSASIVYLNDNLIFGTNDFNQNVDYLEKEVTLEENNTLKVEVRSKPGGTITIELIDITPPVVSITSPNNDFLTNQTKIAVSGDIDDNSATVLVNGITATVENFTYSAVDIPLTEGLNTITAVAADQAGNTDDESVAGTLDTIPPEVAITSPYDGFLTNQGSITVTGTVDDETAIVNLNDAPVTVIDGSFSIDNVLLDEGPNNIILSGTDPAGNEGVHSISIIKDTTPPVIGINTPTDGFLTNYPTITVSGTVTDANGVSSVKVNGVTATINGNEFVAEFISLTEGANTITVTAADLVENTSNADVYGTLDAMPPEIAITEPSDEFLTNQTPVTVSGTVSDNLAVAGVTVNGVTAAINPDGTFTASGIDLAEGANSITATATDTATNSNEASVSGTLDTTPPAVSITDPEDVFLTNQTPVTVSGTVSDNLAVAGVTVNGVTAAINPDGTFTASGIDLAEGANSITATATDTATNSNEASVSGTLDTTPPAVSITDPANGSSTDQPSIDVSGTIDDNNATVEVNGVSATIDAGTFTANITLVEGANTITATATDAAGNSATDSISVTLESNVPLEVSITSPTNKSYTNQSSITVSGTVNNDNASVDINGVTASVSGGTFTVVDVPLSLGPNIITATATHGESSVTNSITVTLDVYDPFIDIYWPENGSTVNTATTFVYGEAEDQSPLTITVNGIEAKILEYSDFVATRIPLTIGENTFTVTATDSAGNTIVETRTVYLNEITSSGVMITFPEEGFVTEQNSIEITGIADESIPLVYINGQYAFPSNGSFNSVINLKKGENHIVVHGYDWDFNRVAMDAITVIADLPPIIPEIIITYPSEGSVINNNSVTVRGKINDTSCIIDANGISARIFSSGTFWARSVPLVNGENIITVTATNEDGTDVESITVIANIDTDPPIITIISPEDGLVTNQDRITVEGTANENLYFVRINDEYASINGSTFQSQGAGVYLVEGENTITIQAYDNSYNVSTVLINVIKDTTPPEISITSPADGLYGDLASIDVSGVIDDDSALVDVNGIQAAVDNGTFVVNGVPLVEGSNTLTATATDAAGNIASDSIGFIRTQQYVQINSPSDGASFNSPYVTVSGEVSSSITQVVVNGINADLTGNTFTALIALPQGNASISAAASDGAGLTINDSVNVLVDFLPPQITISFPAEGQHFTTDNISLQGEINEAVSSVSVNGVPATINGSSFSVSGLQLNQCENVIEVVATDLLGNSSRKSITVYSDIQSPPVTEESGYLVGYVYEFESELPVAGAAVTVEGICGVVWTDADGRYVYPLSGFLSHLASRSFNIKIEKEGYTPITDVVQGTIQKEQTILPIYLTSVDPQVTTITAVTGGVAINSQGNAEVVFPPGAVSDDIDVSITMYESNEQLPAPLPADYKLYAIGQFEPEGTIFNLPVLVRLPNSYNLPVGTAVPCIDYDPKTRTWHYVDDGIVSDDGLFIELEVQHFSWYGATWIPTVDDDEPDPTPECKPDDDDDECELNDQGNSSVSLKNGSLEVSHSTVSYKSLGAGRNITLSYDSNSAYPQRVFAFHTDSDREPKYTRVDLLGFGKQKRVYLTGDSGKYSFLAEAKDSNEEWLKTGIYSYELKLTNYYDITRWMLLIEGWTSRIIEKGYSTSQEGQVVINNKIDSPVGAGWQMGETSRLTLDLANGPVILDGNGNPTRFEPLEYWIDTVAGGGLLDGKDATESVLNSPGRVVVDPEGNIYVADVGHGSIRKISTDGKISTIAGIGVSGTYSGDGLATETVMNPSALAVDDLGNLYIGTSFRIVKLDASGYLTTVAGTGVQAQGPPDENVPATQAQIEMPQDIEFDSVGNMYFVGTNRICKIDTNGIITTLNITLLYPYDMDLDAEDNLYITDYHGSANARSRIIKVDKDGVVTIIADTGTSSLDNIPAIEAYVHWTTGIVVDKIGNIYISETTMHRVRKIDTNGIISTVAGSNYSGFSGDGGDAREAELYRPYGLAIDAVGDLYITDSFNHRVRKVDTNNIINTVAGSGEVDFYGEGGPAKEARFSTRLGVAVDAKDNYYVFDRDSHRIYMIGKDGIIKTVAGNGDSGFSGDGGLATEAGIGDISDVAVDLEGNLYLAGWNRIRKVDKRGIITTVVGTGEGKPSEECGISYNGELATQVKTNPSKLSVDKDGNIYYIEYCNYYNKQRVYRVDTNGIITIIAGNDLLGNDGNYGDDGPALQAFLQVEDIALDSQGNIYLSAYSNYYCAIRKIDSNGIISRFAGKGGGPLYGDSGDGGPALQARLAHPKGLAFDKDDNLYIACSGSGRIRKVDTDGVITTIEGDGTATYKGDGGPALDASQPDVDDLALDSQGNIYLTSRSYLSPSRRVRLCSYYLKPAARKGFLESEDGESSLEIFDDQTAIWHLKNGNRKHYNEKGFLAGNEDKQGNLTSYKYNENDQLVKIIDPLGFETVMAYGADGKLDTITDPAGRITTLDHDSAGNLISIIDPDNSITSYSYDDNHLLTGKTGPNGHTTSYYYSAGHQISRVVSPTGETRDYETISSQGLFNDLPPELGTKYNLAPAVANLPGTKVDGRGFSRTYATDPITNTTSITDPLGNTTVSEKDDFGRIIKTTQPDGVVTNNTYDEKGNLLSRTVEGLGTTSYTYSEDLNLVTSITDIQGNVTSMDYDANGNLTEVTDNQGNSTTTTYYSNGLVHTVTNTLGEVTTYEYDPVSWNLKKVIAPDLTETNYTYDAAGNMLTSTDAEGNVTTYIYDAMNRVASVEDPIHGLTSYAYAASCGCPAGGNGNLTSITDARDRTTSFEYNQIGQLTRKVNTLDEEENYTYDANRNLKTITDAKNQVTIFTYDANNRLTSKTTATDTIHYEYDSMGNVTRIEDSDSGMTMTYDDYGRLFTVNTLASTTQPATTISYTYDLSGKITSRTDPGGTTSYTYDDLNRLVSMTTPAGDISYAYDNLGRRSGITLPTGVNTSYTYNNMGRLTDLVHQLGATVLDSYSYTYDLVGNRTSVTDPDGVHNYLYDDLYRLIQATHPAPQLPDNPEEAFSYDSVGNRLTSHLSASHSYDDGNRLTQDEQYDYTYDANGNVTSRTDKVTLDVTGYTWDAENRLIGINTPASAITYAYDPNGRRIEKNVDGVITRYIYNNEDIILELDGSNNTKAYYVHGPGVDEPIAMQRNGQWYYYHADGLGSIVDLTDSAGNVVNNYLYDSFGNIVDETEGVENFYTYTSREFDNESGLYYYRARYYDASIGRFLSEDPLTCNVDHNYYIYAKNSPINLIDPSGLRPGDEFNSAEQAAIDAIKYINRRSIQECKEYSGWVYKKKNCKYSYDEPIPGWSDGVDVPFKGYNDKVWYHTHGCNKEEVFSRDDKAISNFWGVLGYLGTKYYNIIKYDPKTKKMYLVEIDYH